MEEFHSTPYAVLGFYKVIESAYSSDPGRANRLGEEIARLLAVDNYDFHLRGIGFTKKDSPDKIAAFLREAGRHAVAHANKNPAVNPDDVAQQRQMSAAAFILRAAARCSIIGQFKVGTNRWDQDDLS